MGTFLLVNINYILSSAYIDVVVHCNVLGVWNLAFWACVCLGGANGSQTTRIIADRHCILRSLKRAYRGCVCEWPPCKPPIVNEEEIYRKRVEDHPVQALPRESAHLRLCCPHPLSILFLMPQHLKNSPTPVLQSAHVDLY